MSKQGIIKNLLESGQYTSTDINRIANTPDARKINEHFSRNSKG